MYFLVQFIATDDYSFMTPFDYAVPFIPEFIWVYHTLIPVIIISTIFSMEKRDVFFNTLVALTFSVIVLTLFHIIFPSFYPRQEIQVDTMSLWLVEVTRMIDASCNTFPSGHVTFAWILFFCIRDANCIKRTKALHLAYLLWAILIATSTVVLKQHYVFDVVAGIVLAWFSMTVAKKVRGKISAKQNS
jgi:membrane-associated phospholipid phosphatase